jgi:signal recognition particle receptor subunit beta
MVLFNHATREMTAKIVYYGPGLCGKTTNLLVIYDRLDPKSKGKMLSLATRSDRTLFFDLLPVDLGKVGNFNLRMQLYTVPGQVFYNETRKLVLRGADAVVFVVDSQASLLESNRESFENLLDNLRENRIDPEDVPIVIQYNKRDLPGALSVREIQKHVGLDRYPSIEASAIQGDGVMETFKLVSKLTARKLLQRMSGRESVADETTVPAQSEQEREPFAEAPATSAEGENREDASRFQLADIAAADLGPTLRRGEDAPPFDEQYEKMEEVSLEQLLEGRDRPLPLQHAGSEPARTNDEDEIEELTEQDLLPANVPGSVSFEPIPEAETAAEPPPAEPSPSPEPVVEPIPFGAGAAAVAEEPPPLEEAVAAPVREVRFREEIASAPVAGALDGAGSGDEIADAPVAGAWGRDESLEEIAPAPAAEQAGEDGLREEVDALKQQMADLQSRQEQMVSALQKLVSEFAALLQK